MLLTTFPVRPVRAPRTHSFDRTFAELAELALRSGSHHQPATSATWSDGAYVLTVDVPGVPEEALSVSVTGRTLVIDVATTDLNWNDRIRLPHTLDVEAATATYTNGRLTVTVPASPQAQPRKVEITVGAPAAAELDSPGDQPADGARNDTE